MKDAYPVSNGHILIIPYEHTENWFTAREEVRLDIMEAMHKIKENLVEKRRRSKKTSQQSFSMPFSTVLLSLCDVKNR
jgi:diadenosine tetraphosphate (Ap4A) HIT family hydrolase